MIYNDFGTVRFGIDDDGNYGYKKVGADTVTPFKTGKESMVGTAEAAQVLSGYTFTNSSDVGIDGSMTNNGAVSGSVGVGGSYTVPAGYHNGSGTVSGPTLSGTAGTSQVLSGYTFYSNSGTQQSGAMTNRGAWTGTVSAGSKTTIPAGYHNGSGYISGKAGGTVSISSKTTSSGPVDDVSSISFTASGLSSGTRYVLSLGIGSAASNFTITPSASGASISKISQTYYARGAWTGTSCLCLLVASSSSATIKFTFSTSFGGAWGACIGTLSVS